jgi:anti-anti-sigma factor
VADSLLLVARSDGVWDNFWPDLRRPYPMSVSHFKIDERQERGWLRLALTGELDLAAAPVLDARLGQLRAEHVAVRLDLSKLQFMDSSGLQVLLRSITDARENGWNLEIDPHRSPVVQRLFELTGIDRHLLDASGSR